MNISFALRVLPLILRGLWVRGLIHLMGGKCGMIFVDRGFSLRHLPHKGIEIGDRVGFGPNVKIFVPPGGRLVIGDSCMFTSDVFISACQSVEIGADTLVAEFTSIRDADHSYDRLDLLIRQQPMKVSPIFISNNVWIGRGVAVLRGSQIGAGAVIGANAVVKSTIPDHCVAVGAPARVIRDQAARTGVSYPICSLNSHYRIDEPILL